MPTSTYVLAIARRELGQTEHPAGSNRCKYTEWYGLIGPWCAIFVSWVAAKSGASGIIPRHAWTPAGAAWFQQHGQWHVSGPRPGDVVYFEWPGMGRICHVGLVEAVHSDGSITTIEGNTDVAGGRTGGKVMRQRRSKYISGYGRPAYTRVVAPSRAASRAPVYPLRSNQWYGSGSVVRGAGLRTWQARMKGLGYHIAVDGIYGPETRGVAKSFQRRRHLAVDGLIGPKTWAASW